MSRVLATLLDKPETHIAGVINKLEQKVGYKSEDVRLLAESAQKVKAKIRDLGLDPNDTTGEELYHALLARFERDGAIIDRALGVSKEASLTDKLEKAKSFLEHMEGIGQVWALKKGQLRKTLISLGVPKTLRRLHYRSLDSMLKREDTFELAYGATLLESPTWLRNFNSKLAKYTSADFELRPVQLVVLERKKWGVANTANNSSRLGVAAIAESTVANRISVLSLTLALHDQISQMATVKPAKKLSHLNPTLAWWEDAEHLMAWNDGQPISLNYKDIAQAHINGASYEDRSKEKAKMAFWNELVSRYKDKLEALPADIVAAEEMAEEKTGELLNPAKEFATEMEGIDNNG